MPTLFDPVQFGAIAASNRAVMAPLTRGRATDDHVPTPLMVEYYRQRATAGLIITEGTGISHEGLGWPNTPGIWSDAQVEAWKPVTEAVHAAGGRIVTQLWHLGRLARKDVTGRVPLSSSATAGPGKDDDPDAVAAPMTRDDIARTLDDYSRAARNAVRAGFDGVALHAANGYLIDQFMRDGANFRDDDYGGSVDNRLRLLREVVDRLVAEAGADRTGVRLSPNGDSQGVDDSDPKGLFVPAAAHLGSLGLAFLELREQGPDSSFSRSDVPKLSPAIRKVFAGPLILNQDYALDSAQADLASGLADAISFGRPFLANPDLVDRLRRGAPLNAPDKATFYTPGARGYTDYPALAA